MSHLEMKNAVVKGHHAYQHNVAVGDTYECYCEPGNPYDPTAVAVYRNHEIIGHLPTGLCSTIFNILCSFVGKIQIIW